MYKKHTGIRVIVTDDTSTYTGNRWTEKHGAEFLSCHGQRLWLTICEHVAEEVAQHMMISMGLNKRPNIVPYVCGNIMRCLNVTMYLYIDKDVPGLVEAVIMGSDVIEEVATMYRRGKLVDHLKDGDGAYIAKQLGVAPGLVIQVNRFTRWNNRVVQALRITDKNNRQLSQQLQGVRS